MDRMMTLFAVSQLKYVQGTPHIQLVFALPRLAVSPLSSMLRYFRKRALSGKTPLQVLWRARPAHVPAPPHLLPGRA
jgi:hypothetical protein